MLEIEEHRFTEEEERLFETLGITKGDRMLMADIARHAAQQAVDTIHTIATTLPDPRMVNVVMLSACAMLGEAARHTVNEKMTAMIDRLPIELRERFEALHNEVSKPKKARDFDGNYD
jgi:hypothetical protein